MSTQRSRCKPVHGNTRRPKALTRAALAQARVLAGLCTNIHRQTSHTTGLTKNVLFLLKAAAIQIATGRCASAIAIDAHRRRLTAGAIQLATGRGAAAQSPGVSGIERQIVARMAAILRLGIALRTCRHTEDIRIRDTEDSVEIVVPAPASNRCLAAIRKAVAAWNQVMPRPIGDILLGRPADATPAPETPVSELARRILLRQMETLASREYGAGYDADPEFIHEMRVATRRLREAVRLFGNVLELADVGEHLRRIADVLGAARDADVFRLFLRSRRAAADRDPFWAALYEASDERRRNRIRRVLDMLASKEYQEFRSWFFGQLRTGVATAGGLRPKNEWMVPGETFARRALRRLLCKAMEYGDLGRYTVREIHQLRIRCKRLRYAAEFFAGLQAGKLKRRIDAVADIQDRLGDFHDAEVFADRILQCVRQRPKLARCKSRKQLQRYLQQWNKREFRKGRDLWQAFRRQRRKWRKAIDSIRSR